MLAGIILIVRISSFNWFQVKKKYNFSIEYILKRIRVSEKKIWGVKTYIYIYINVFFGVQADQNISKQLQKAIKSHAYWQLLMLCQRSL